MLLLSVGGLAHAADPDLAGVHLALGAGLTTSVGTTNPPTSPAEVGIRLHVGPRWILELGAAGGITRDDDLRASYARSGEDTVVTRHDETDLSGWSAAAGLRARFRVDPKGPVGLYVGLGGSYVVDASSGPLLEEVEDPDTEEATVEEIGRQEVTGNGVAIDASLAAVHWVTDRVALSGTLTVPFAAWESSTTRDIDTTGSQEYESDVVTSSRAIYGFYPQVGVYVHVRL